MGETIVRILAGEQMSLKRLLIQLSRNALLERIAHLHLCDLTYPLRILCFFRLLQQLQGLRVSLSRLLDDQGGKNVACHPNILSVLVVYW